MDLKRIATLGLVCGAVAAAWLVAAASPSGTRQPAPSRDEHSVAIDASSEALAKEVARLHERLRPTATPRQPGRNLFQFTAMRPSVVPPLPKTAATEVGTPPMPASPPVAFKLIGIAEDPGPEGPVRTAILSGPGQVFLVKEGQSVTLRYRVARISADVVELADAGNGTTLRLALK